MTMTILSEFILQFHVAFRLLPSIQPLLTFSQNYSWEQALCTWYKTAVLESKSRPGTRQTKGIHNFKW